MAGSSVGVGFEVRIVGEMRGLGLKGFEELEVSAKKWGFGVSLEIAPRRKEADGQREALFGENYVVPPTAFATWADDILGNADFVELLRKADVHRTVVNSLRLVVLRERKWMDVVVSRWSTDSHTLPVAWGETGPTLEDVGCLLKLPMLGKVDSSSGRLSTTQKGVVDALRKSVRWEKAPDGVKKGHNGVKKGHSGVKNTFTKWARYWCKDLGASNAGEEAQVVADGPGLKKPAHLATFLAYWLTWYIFPGPPKDGVNTALFELAAILASGESVPLAPLFLGTLFKRLDMLHDAARCACGRYDLPIYVATNFLDMCSFERFPKVAPKQNDFKADDGGGKRELCWNLCWSARWSGSGVRDMRGSIADVLDIEGEFVAQPSSHVFGVEDVMSQDGELCLPKVKDPALSYVKEEDGEGRVEGVRLSGKRTSKRQAKDIVEVAKPSKRKKTAKGNEESSQAVQPSVAEEMVRIPRVEVPETETGGGLEVPSTSIEGVSSRRVPQPNVVEEVRNAQRMEVSETTAGGGLDVLLDSLEAIARFNHMEGGDGGESLVQNSSSLQDETNEGGLHRSHCWWKKGNFMIARYPDGSVIVTLETKEKVTLQPSVLFAEAREEHRPLLSNIFFQWPSTFVQLGNMSTFSRRLALISLVSFVELLEDVSLPKATPEEFIFVYGGLAALGSYQLEVDWLRKRIDQMALLLELPAWRVGELAENIGRQYLNGRLSEAIRDVIFSMAVHVWSYAQWNEVMLGGDYSGESLNRKAKSPSFLCRERAVRRQVVEGLGVLLPNIGSSSSVVGRKAGSRSWD
ncbi:hypothetical protein RHSIM_Rhsim06G0084000 [Rhododendron simsii]|uniref:Aminotransferase-like plant mobile domain-containing protein n=1 Tax=Rhododendron simsii TaxID=118357 RepID=A0A834GVQ9_RHOSS|nr:hypothetical protein RHSIM_Rhsim06G0084000 [Rhododendron simsii]